MPKKGKKGKKAAAEEAARLEAEQKAKEAEEKRKFEEEMPPEMMALQRGEHPSQRKRSLSGEANLDQQQMLSDAVGKATAIARSAAVLKSKQAKHRWDRGAHPPLFQRCRTLKS